jgi:hypothetical protein
MVNLFRLDQNSSATIARNKGIEKDSLLTVNTK